MAPATFTLLSGALTFGVPLLLAVHELVALRREGRGSGGYDDPREDAPPPPLPGCEPDLPSLPACLIEAARTDVVARQTSRERALEPA